jgi:hypothetical protein
MATDVKPIRSGTLDGDRLDVRRHGARSIVLAFLVCALVGCVTSKKYRLAKADSSAAQPPALSISSASLQLDTIVIVFRGPGSWKAEARWDEYVVRLVNHREQSIVIEWGELIDLQGQPRAPGDDPWKLEKLSRSNWQRYRTQGLHVVEGIGAATLYAGAVVGAGNAAILSGGAAGGGAAMFTALPLIGLVNVSVVAVMNHRNKARVEAEFQRRRLNLPFPLAPGEARAGSFFFPMTPGPKMLALHGHDGEQPIDVVFELDPLATLHLTPAK